MPFILRFVIDNMRSKIYIDNCNIIYITPKRLDRVQRAFSRGSKKDKIIQVSDSGLSLRLCWGN